MRKFFSTCLLLAAAALFAEDSSERHPLFQDDEILRAVLTAPIAQAYAQRDQDVRIYMPGTFTYSDDDGKVHRRASV